MYQNIRSARLGGILVVATILLVAGCATPKPRTDDPFEKVNRKVYAFNDAADKAVIRPLAVGYRKVTSANVRRVVSNFFANIKMPITIVNDVLQANPKATAQNTGRFVINSTVGFAGFFDPASELKLPPQNTDFGVTLAKWGAPEGPYLVLPLFGSSSARDIFRLPVDYYLDPLTWYSREHDLKFHAESAPNFLYLITLRARGIEGEGLLDGVYDPYVFYRDAYRQRRIYDIYNGQPPAEIIEQMQGTNDIDVDKLLDEQHKYEQQQSKPALKP